jgi:hypothetical protein
MNNKQRIGKKNIGDGAKMEGEFGGVFGVED